MFLWLWVILIAGFFAPGVNRIFGSRGGMGLALVPAGVFACLLKLWPSVMNQRDISASIEWAPMLDLAASLRLDGLSLLFGLLVTGIGTLVLVYAGGYLKGDARLGQLWMLLLFFMAAMLGLVLADNLLTLFVFWELTSITSYLLIGFNNERLESRRSALQALLVTAGGGLMLLPGLLLLGLAGQSFEISELLSHAEEIRQHSFYGPILILILVGAFTKSAQFPFHFWLPNAMAAPTPISAYLHSATMVKAGIYLIARLHPVLGGTAEWFWMIAPVGTITMMLGAMMALRATDLKQILAYATISVLGTLTMLLGIGTQATITAALAVLVAHAFYKCGLFMMAGSVDHAVHQRDIRELGGLRTAMPMTFAAACLAGVSMAGVLPTFGFLAKETWYAAIEHVADVPFLTASVLSNIGLVAAVGLVCIKPFFAQRTDATQQAHEVGPAMWGPPLALGLGGLLLGPISSNVSDLLAAGSSAVMGRIVPVHLALWHGVNMTLLLSLLTLAGGIAMYWQRHQWKYVFAILNRFISYGPSWIYEWTLKSFNDLARWQTAILQNGYLRYYLIVMVGLTVVSVWMALGSGMLSHLELMPLDFRIYEILLAGLILVAAVVAVRAGTWPLAVGALGIVGYGVAGLFVLFGAPDLAMTQFVIETLTVLLFVMAFSRLPDFSFLSPLRTRVRDALIAIVAGATISVLLLFAMTVRSNHPISHYYITHSVAEAHGRNVVNVILVDFRALDTLGEITVLAIAAIGVYSLLMLRPAKGAVAESKVNKSASELVNADSRETHSADGFGPGPEQERRG